MVANVRRRCQHIGCRRLSTHAMGGNNATRCAVHRTAGMHVYKDALVCVREYCTRPATYGVQDPLGYPVSKYCVNHAMTYSVELFCTHCAARGRRQRISCSKPTPESPPIYRCPRHAGGEPADLDSVPLADYEPEMLEDYEEVPRVAERQCEACGARAVYGTNMHRGKITPARCPFHKLRGDKNSVFDYCRTIGCARLATSGRPPRDPNDAPVMVACGMHRTNRMTATLDDCMPQPKRETLPAANMPLPAADMPLPAADMPLPAADMPLPAADMPLPAADMPLPAADMQFPAANMQFPAANMQFPAANMPLPAANMQFPAADIPIPSRASRKRKNNAGGRVSRAVRSTAAAAAAAPARYVGAAAAPQTGGVTMEDIWSPVEPKLPATESYYAYLTDNDPSPSTKGATAGGVYVGDESPGITSCVVRVAPEHDPPNACEVSGCMRSSARAEDRCWRENPLGSMCYEHIWDRAIIRPILDTRPVYDMVDLADWPHMFA